ncbi:MAG: hypothetical protein E6H95_07240 [Chloroflexi bacterium]|nr:MAG: hypothetical protein E6H95_07240 [Chloroflexota bacterium]
MGDDTRPARESSLDTALLGDVLDGPSTKAATTVYPPSASAGRDAVATPRPVLDQPGASVTFA